MEKKTKR